MRWGFTKQRANQLISSGAAAEKIDNNCCQKPATESQARELAKAPAEEQPRIWQQVCDEHGAKVTAAKVKQAVDVATGKGGRTSRKLLNIRKLMQLMACFRNVGDYFLA